MSPRRCTDKRQLNQENLSRSLILRKLSLALGTRTIMLNEFFLDAPQN